jgi:hypothetical protein
MDVTVVGHLAGGLLLPQMAAALMWRSQRRPRRAAVWPATAFLIWCATWYATVWRPAELIAQSHEVKCGEWVVGSAFLLLAGLIFHMVAAALFAWIAHRRWNGQRRPRV